MKQEKKPLIAKTSVEFTPLVNDMRSGDMFPTRDADSQKIAITDLFLHFTANIIQENVTFTR